MCVQVAQDAERLRSELAAKTSTITRLQTQADGFADAAEQAAQQVEKLMRVLKDKVRKMTGHCHFQYQ